MNKCTETTRRWPDRLADISPDEFDDFRAHADACPHHARTLDAAEEELFADARAALQLGGGKFLPLGDELRQLAAENRRTLERWREVAGKKELPFTHLALYNAGNLFASSGSFFKLNNHDAEHKLDPEAGIQIWGVVDNDDVRVEARIATYELAGVRHTGEKTYPLANGFTVALNVTRIREETFRVELRCVETESLGRQGAEKRTSARAPAAGGDATPGGAGTVTRSPAGEGRLSVRATPRARAHHPTAKRYAVYLLLVVTGAALTTGVILKQPSLLAGLREEQAARQVDTRVPSTAPTPAPVAPPGQDERVPAREKRHPAREQQESSAASAKRERFDGKIEQQLLSYSNGRPRQEQVPDERPELSSESATRPRRVSTPEAGQDYTAHRLWIYRDEGVTKPRRVVVVSVDDNEARVRQMLLKQLEAELAAYSGKVWSVNTHRVEHASEELSKVKLALSEGDAGQQPSVRLSVSVEAGGQNHNPVPFHGSGNSIEAASTQALAQAMPEVFTTIAQLLSQPTTPPPGGSGGSGGDDLTGKELRLSDLRNTEGTPGVRRPPSRYCEDS